MFGEYSYNINLCDDMRYSYRFSLQERLNLTSCVRDDFGIFRDISGWLLCLGGTKSSL